MPTLKLTLEYIGTAYHGWQIQPDQPTVQGTLEQCLRTVLREKVEARGAARTDAGVHALGQVASVRLPTGVDAGRLLRSLNAVLPSDIGVRRVDVVPEGFHARHSATGRLYRYQMVHGPYRSPFLRDFCTYVRRPLDLEQMRKASLVLLGEHDFSCFRGAGDISPSPVRTIRRIEISESEGLATLTIEANSFLQYMVRNIAGTLIEVGSLRMTPERVSELLEAGDRSLAGPTAPARGLFLVEVLYGAVAGGTGG